MRRRPAILTHGVAVLALLLVLLVGLLATPATAFAREYSIPRVRIYATLQADGTLGVTEGRTYDINGEYHGVYWDLSRDGGEGSGLAITVRSCGIVSGNDISSSGGSAPKTMRATPHLPSSTRSASPTQNWPS